MNLFGKIGKKIINMVSINLSGGLGNQMFQIAACYQHSINNNDVAIYDLNLCYTPNQGFNSSKYKDNIFSKLNVGKLNNVENIYNERKHYYEDIPYRNNQILNGYFQSYKYFSDKIINDIFLFKDEFIVINFLKKYESYITCSIHIRRGDYLNFSNIYNVLDVDYYNSAISIIKSKYENIIFFIISDDVNYCKKIFNGDDYVYPDFNNEVLDLLLIKNCFLNINSNSTFSWWGSKLNKNINYFKIFPSKWFNENTIDYKIEDKVDINNIYNIII